VKKYLNYIFIGIAIVALIGAFLYRHFTPKSMELELNEGSEIIAINLPNKDGDFISTTDFKGKILLVDFWASWCRPCRMESPFLVNSYNKYKNAEFKNAKGFEIYSISLDQDRQKWLNAIENDGLTWTNHVCDFKGWDCPVVNHFKIKFIPSSILLDENGKVIATDLRGNDLEKQLDKLLK